MMMIVNQISVLKTGLPSLVLAGLWFTIGSGLAKAEDQTPALAGHGKPAEGKIQLYVLAHPTAEDVKIKPDTFPVPGRVDRKIFIVASPGEYASASFVVRSRDPLALEVKAGQLQGPAGNIPSANLNLRSVKCWYQDRSGGWPANAMKYTGDRVLTPELLLKDNSLIRVDNDNQDNYVKIATPDGGSREICISKKGGVPATEPFLIKDSAFLLPLNLAPNTNQQFWLTLKVPADAVPGIYAGDINIGAVGTTPEILELNVRVLPIKLLAPYYTSSIYYIQPPSDFKQFKKEMQNLYAHGVTNPTFPFGAKDAWLGIGSSQYEATNNCFFIGSIDEVKIYQRALRQEELLKSFHAPGTKKVYDPSLAGSWQFDEGKGTVAKDASASGNDGTIHGAEWTPGVSGSALEFKTNNGYVDCGNNAVLRVTDGSLTMECWIKTTDAAENGLFPNGVMTAVGIRCPCHKVNWGSN
ncbi:MAG: hypothetical protein WCH61_02385 [bacterium]